MKAAELRPLLGVDYSAEQLAAATAPLEPALVLAAAGTGKTTVMAARVVWLVLTGAVAAEQILGVTFTRKAAGELASRVRAALRRARGDGAGDGAEGEPTVCTYHAYALQLVREHGMRLGMDGDVELAGDARRYLLAERTVRLSRGPYLDLPLHLPTVVEGVLALDAELAEHLVYPARLRAHDQDLLARLPAPAAGRSLPGAGRQAVAATRAAAAGRLEITALVEELRAAKAGAGATDFADLITAAVRLAEECPPVGEAERARYRAVLLDEYQDTSVAQRTLLRSLFGAGHPVTAVGDPCQAIYGWRGASVANIDQFPRQFPRRDGSGAAVFPLGVNRRSVVAVLEVANAVSDGLRRRHATPLLLPGPQPEAGGAVEVALLGDHRGELDWLAGRVAALLAVGSRWRPGDVAVLARTRDELPVLQQALTAAGVPAVVVGLGGLLTVPVVAEVVATLRLLADPLDNATAVRLLAGPRWRMGTADLAALGRRAAELAAAAASATGRGEARAPRPAAGQRPPDRILAPVDPDLEGCLLDAAADLGPAAVTAPGRDRLAVFHREFRELAGHLTGGLPDLVQRVLDVTGLEAEVLSQPPAEAAAAAGALRALQAVVAQVGSAAAAGSAARPIGHGAPTPLSALLAYLAAASQYERGLAQDEPANPAAVQLMTIHAAKGLEWPIVALPGLVAGNFPATRLRDSWTTCRHVLPRPLRGDLDGAGVEAPPTWDRAGFDLFAAACRQRQLQEEERLLYVAVTRARSVLLASGHWWGPTQTRRRGPSQFLTALAEAAAVLPGSAVTWTDEPDDPTNPLLELAGEQQPWPALPDADVTARRQRAAAAVRAAMAAPAPGGLAPPSPADALRRRWREDSERLLAEAAGRHRSTIEVELPRALSTTGLMAARRDPDGFARELRRPLPHPPGMAARRGSRFHAWLEERFAVRQQALFDEEELLADRAATSGTHPGEESRQLAELRRAFLATPWADRRPAAVEQPFVLAVGGYVVRGRIDAVYAEPGGRWHVVDWKTGRQAADPLQLAIYRLAWARHAGCPLADVRASFLQLPSGRLQTPGDLPDATALAALLDGTPQRPGAGAGRSMSTTSAW